MRHIRPDELPADGRARRVLARFCQEAHRLAPDRIGRIIVYGSMARGDAGPESDLDLWVDWNGDEAEGWDVLGQLAADLFLETGLIVSVHVVGAKHRERMRDSLFYGAVQQEGAIVEA